jgi:molybdopterin adenylyltransferase
MPIDTSLPFEPIRIAVLTISDSRTNKNDVSGQLLVDKITTAGHQCAYKHIVPDEVDLIISHLTNAIDDPAVDCVITVGGTGVTGRDVTPEAIERLGGKMIPGFGELFRWLSYATIGTSTIQSRACATVVRGTFIFSLPGSSGAVKDGWDGILSFQLDSRHRPCNFVELMPRLNEK